MDGLLVEIQFELNRMCISVYVLSLFIHNSSLTGHTSVYWEHEMVYLKGICRNNCRRIWEREREHELERIYWRWSAIYRKHPNSSWIIIFWVFKIYILCVLCKQIHVKSVQHNTQYTLYVSKWFEMDITLWIRVQQNQLLNIYLFVCVCVRVLCPNRKHNVHLAIMKMVFGRSKHTQTLKLSQSVWYSMRKFIK